MCAFYLRNSARCNRAIKILSLSFASSITVCQNEGKRLEESAINPNKFKKVTMSQNFLYKIFRKDLPTPRILSPSDPIFESHKMKKCVKNRKADEKKLQRIQAEIMACVQAKDRQCVESNMQKVNEILYGKGVTMQAREEFMIKYGCTPYDEKILDKILAFDRLIMDIGAGNGQWSRALSDRAKKVFSSSSTPNKKFGNDHIVAYDDQSAIPLNTSIYHKFTQPAKDYFFEVKNMDGANAVKLIKNRGRILLLVYPAPGPMAIDVVKSYAKFEGNDLVIFVGEGLGGANGNIELFNFFKTVDKHGYGWILLDIMNVPLIPGGGKGLEKVFIFKKMKLE